MSQLPLIILSIALAAGPLSEDLPMVPPPHNGEIGGLIASATPLDSIKAVVRDSGKTFAADRFDPSSGTFAFRNLPGDERYDLVLTTGNRQVEGINLDFVESRLMRLAERRRAELGLPATPAHAFTAADANEMLKYVAGLQDFMDIRRVFYVAGHGRTATMLVELMRTREFHAAKAGELIWRVELWYFEYNYGGWQRLANQERILRRERLPLEQWRKIDVEYYPELSICLSPEGKSQPVKFTVPDRHDPSSSRPAGSDVELKTTPRILGIDPPEETTQPVTSR